MKEKNGNDKYFKKNNFLSKVLFCNEIKLWKKKKLKTVKW